MTVQQLVTIIFIVLYLIEAISNYRLKKMIKKICEDFNYDNWFRKTILWHNFRKEVKDETM